MGYKTDHPERWTAKRTATPEDRKELEELLRRSPKWHELANKRVRKYCIKLGYDCNRVQNSEEWLTVFDETLLTVEYWSERKRIQQLSKIGPRRVDYLLQVLYLFAQHGRLQFKPSIGAATAPDDGSPFEELRGNHHNLDHQLLRIACHLCGYRDKHRPEKNGALATFVQNLTGRYLGSSANDINPNRVARWAQVADIAAGVAPRHVERLRKASNRTKGSASNELRKRAWLHFRQAWAAKTPANTWMFLLFCGCDAYGLYYLFRWLRRLLHF